MSGFYHRIYSFFEVGIFWDENVIILYLGIDPFILLFTHFLYYNTFLPLGETQASKSSKVKYNKLNFNLINHKDKWRNIIEETTKEIPRQ